MSDSAVPFFTEREGYWEARVGECDSFARLLEQMEEIRIFCADRRPSRLLLDLRPVSMSMAFTERYELGALGERFVGLVTRVAAVAQPSMIDREKFGARVAQNRGLDIDVFAHPDEAVRWLLLP